MKTLIFIIAMMMTIPASADVLDWNDYDTTHTALIQILPRGTYYVSTAGDDATSGTSTRPWASVAALDLYKFEAGSTIKFKCGGEWRYSVLMPQNGVRYTSYGTGPKPKIEHLLIERITTTTVSGLLFKHAEIRGTTQTLTIGFYK